MTGQDNPGTTGAKTRGGIGTAGDRGYPTVAFPGPKLFTRRQFVRGQFPARRKTQVPIGLEDPKHSRIIEVNGTGGRGSGW